MSTDYLLGMATRCRSLANTISDRRTIDALLALARECDEKAAATKVPAESKPQAEPE